jgi:hypothetical protein
MVTALRMIVIIAIAAAAAGACAAEPGSQTRVLWDCESTADTKGLTLDRTNVKQGRAAVRWRDHPQTSGFSVPNVPQDWSGFNLLQFWAYSAKATGDVITLTADSDTPRVTHAEQVMKHIYGGYDLGQDIDWESNKYVPDDPAFTKEWTYGLNRFPHWRTLGQAYWQAGDERYAQEWIAQMRDWVEDNRYPIIGTGNDTLTWRTIEGETYETDSPLGNLWHHGDVFDAVDGVYDSGYGPKREIDVKHERTVVFVRPDYWAVLDRLHTTGEHKYDLLWHLNNDEAVHDPTTLAAWGADRDVANLLVTPASVDGLTLEVVKGRDEPVLGFAPASSKKPIPVLNYKLQANGPVTRAWVLTPFRDSRPSVTATVEERPAGTVPTVTHASGTDYVHVARRGEQHSVTLSGNKLHGQIAVVRTNRNGEVIAADNR